MFVCTGRRWSTFSTGIDLSSQSPLSLVLPLSLGDVWTLLYRRLSKPQVKQLITPSYGIPFVVRFANAVMDTGIS